MSGGVAAIFCSVSQYDIWTVAVYRPVLIVPLVLPSVTASFLFFNVSIWDVSLRMIWTMADMVINIASYIPSHVGVASGSIMLLGILLHEALFCVICLMGLIIVSAQKILHAPCDVWSWALRLNSVGRSNSSPAPSSPIRLRSQPEPHPTAVIEPTVLADDVDGFATTPGKSRPASPPVVSSGVRQVKGRLWKRFNPTFCWWVKRRNTCAVSHVWPKMRKTF